MEKNPIIYVILNKELNMSAGKAAAQTAHAVAMIQDKLPAFLDHNKRTVIVLEADNQQQITNLWEYLDNEGLTSEYYIDEGANEVAPFSITAMAVEPIAAGDEERREIFSGFSLYGGPSNVEEQAYQYLKQVRWDRLDGLEENTPWYLRQTIKWLKKNK